MLSQLFSRCCTGVIALTLSAAAAQVAAGDDPDSLELFEKQVRPVLVDQCIRCHGEKKQQGGLRLDSRQGWSMGGDSGPAIVPGKPEESLLIQAIRYQNNELEMPPKGILPEQTIAAFEHWVRSGASDPRTSDWQDDSGSDSPSIEQGRQFWSFQPIARPEVPAVKDASWPYTTIDRFILAQLEKESLVPVSDADRRTLVRRVYFDLIGLPPTPKQIDEFLNDPSPSAYAALIDRLLESPQFGQRWGRHWLDVVRFAESSGGGRTLLFPDAWRYRDYVIDSFNNDLPYDQFLREQLAGDLLPSAEWQDRRRKLIATAFLLLGPTNYELQDKDVLEMDVVDEQLDTIGKGMLGMTIGCARCHDHKFDPIPTVDYYALAGILRSTKAMIHSNVSQWNTMELPLPAEEEAEIKAHQEKIAAAKSKLDAATAKWRKAGGKPDKNAKKNKDKSIDPDSIDGIVVDDTDAQRIGQWTESTSIAGFVGPRYIHDATADKGQKSVIYQPDLPRPGQYEVRVAYTPSSNRSARVPVHVHHNDGETVVKVNQRAKPDIDDALTSLGVFTFDPTRQPRVVISNEGTDDGVVIADAVVFLAKESDAQPALPKPKPRDAKVAKAEDPADAQKQAMIQRLQAEVDALTKELESLEAAAPKRPVAMATTDDEDAGDIHLAIRGVVHNRGPITPRGVLQVASHRPFPQIPQGQSGRAQLANWISHPDHPLTARVMANRVWYWLIGNGIVTTVDNFGSMGQPPTHPDLLDHLAASLIEGGWSIKSLIRDIMLSRTYQLRSQPTDEAVAADPGNRLLSHMNRKRLRAEDIRDALLFIGGGLDTTAGGSNIQPGTKSEYGYVFQSKRRSVYVPVFRNTLPELFEVFDFADPNIQSGRRTTSTIASQALLMMNHPFVIEQSRSAANRLVGRMNEPDQETGRGQWDTPSRVRQAYRQVLGRDPGSKEMAIAVDFIESASEDDDRLASWAMLYQTLFQSIDFRYLN